MNGTVFFNANDGVSGCELWKSDGTESGTVTVKDTNLGTGSAITELNGMIFLAANDGSSGFELWKSDGTDLGTVMVKDINPSASSSPKRLINMNGTLFFGANDGVNGAELWKSDGTAAGTVMVKDINPGPERSYPEYPANVNGTLFFNADDGVSGCELWKSDGTESGTVMVKDINPGSDESYPEELTEANGMLFFNAEETLHGRELWAFSIAQIDDDGDGIHNDVDEKPNVVSTRFSDVGIGGTTSGRILGLDTGITIEIMDAPDPAEGVTVLVSGSSGGVARIKIDGSKGTYKLSPGEYVLTSGSVTLVVLVGRAEVDFTIVGKMILVAVEGIVIFEETIIGGELWKLVVQVLEGNVSVDDKVVGPGESLTTMSVSIDIKPGSDSNCLNSDGHGVIPVAILSSGDFDATQVDHTTVSLDGQAVRVVGKGKAQAHIEDATGDGLDDLVVQIEDEDGTYQQGDTIATVTGETFDGTYIIGTDTICIVP